MRRPFHRLAIVNRGEPARRLLHAVRDHNELAADQIQAIALYTDAEPRAMFVREADEAVRLGPATVVDAAGARTSGYLDAVALERALVTARADAAWVGWGFVAERPEFVELCDRLGIVFVGPDATTMRRLGDKISAKLLAEEAGVPVAAWSGGPVETLDDALARAAEIGYPVAIKATAGGGGRGIRRVERPEDLAVAFERARAEAGAFFGDATVFLERLITPARHVEVQIIGDGETVWAVGTRDCTIQRRHQKVLEETAGPPLAPAEEQALREASVRLASLVGYCGAGTVEFLVDLTTGRASFMEVNARLQVEHPVTELTTGVDLVRLQLHVAAGGRLEGEPPPPRGHAIEVRLNAEDPDRGFAPAPGTVELLRFPTGPGVRVDTGVGPGDSIPAEFDSMIAKILAWGSDRAEALGRLRRALRETTVVVRGGTTNHGFLLGLLERPEVERGDVDNTWLDRLADAGETAAERLADVALVQAAIDAYDAQIAVERARFQASAARGRPRAATDIGEPVELTFRGNRYPLRVYRLAPALYRVTTDGAATEARVERLGAYEGRLACGGETHRIVSIVHGIDHLVEVDGVPHRFSRDEGGLVRAIAPSVVVALPVGPGDEVAAGDTVAVVESMKMELAIAAPFSGRVRSVLVGTNVQVDAGTPLVQLDAIERDGGGPPAARVSLPVGASPLGDALHCRADLDSAVNLILGYDVTDDDARQIVADQHEVCDRCAPTDLDLLAAEHVVLQTFADLRRLTRSRHDEIEGDGAGDFGRSPEEHLHAFLRSYDPETEGIPEAYVGQLRCALARYGVESLDRTPELEEALFRIVRSQQRVAPQVAIVQGILDRRLERTEQLRGLVDEELGEVLDALVEATQAREPQVADLAREVRFRAFDEPRLDAARDGVYAEMEGHLAALASTAPADARATHIDALVECPLPLAPLLTAALATSGSPEVRCTILEVMTRRYYRMRPLEGFGVERSDGREVVRASYVLDEHRYHVLTTHLDLDDLAAGATEVAAMAGEIPETDVVAIDLYTRGSSPLDADQRAAQIGAALATVAFPPALHRVVVVVCRPEQGRGMGAVEHYTFRPQPGGGLGEDAAIRGLHPLMAKRLHLWRLANFRIERLPSAEDVYAFRAVARENPKDERLFVVAEVRSLSPRRDDSGRLVGLPEVEAALVEAFDAIRRFQARRPAAQRLQWNRILLYVWPPVELDLAELDPVIRSLSQAGAGLGIETVLVRGRFQLPGGGLGDRVLRVANVAGSGLTVDLDDPPTEPLRPLDEYTQKVVQSRRRGTVYPYELVQVLAPAPGGTTAGIPPGEFLELDLDPSGARLVAVDRPPGRNEAGIVVGILRSFTDRYPDGMTRIALLGDPTRALGSIAEPECRRINAALDLAEQLRVPVEWFALSAGAKIAMDSGTENMDWVAAVLRRLIEFTQAGGEVNVVVAGINVGAQPYWNAEATMLMHTKGILVMTPDSAMVLTGKQALDYSGGVSADDNFGIGGYERVMGPNGQAQYWAPDLAGACRLLLRHYDYSYVAPGERFPRRAATTDPAERDVGPSPHRGPGTEFATVGEIFSEVTNPERKKPFDIRSVMRAVVDQDHPPLERWMAMHDADTAVVWDAHLGGRPVTVLGIESRPMPRHGAVPADGPDQWTSGTLFPLSSKKVARAINAASGSRPLVVLANLSGFDGSPESMRTRQLEFGAEIGRAVVNFDGPIVFCVISRYHGGAFVVFSTRLNEEIHAVALEGSHASVIGGAPAAAVVFAGEVERRARQDPRVVTLEEQIADAAGAERTRLRSELADMRAVVRSEKLGEVAAEFDAVHSVERAQEMGSVHEIIPPDQLRPYVIEAVERGVRRVLDRLGLER